MSKNIQTKEEAYSKICKFINKNINDKLEIELPKIKYKIEEIKKEYTDGNYFKIPNLVNELLDDIVSDREVLNSLIYLYNEYIYNNLYKKDKDANNFWEKTLSFFKNNKMEYIEEFKPITIKSIFHNKSVISNTFKKIKENDRDFKNLFVEVIKTFIKNLIDTCNKCQGNIEPNKFSSYLNKEIEKIVLKKLKNYIEELSKEDKKKEEETIIIKDIYNFAKDKISNINKDKLRQFLIEELNQN